MVLLSHESALPELQSPPGCCPLVRRSYEVCQRMNPGFWQRMELSQPLASTCLPLSGTGLRDCPQSLTSTKHNFEIFPVKYNLTKMFSQFIWTFLSSRVSSLRQNSILFASREKKQKCWMKTPLCKPKDSEPYGEGCILLMKNKSGGCKFRTVTEQL